MVVVSEIFLERETANDEDGVVVAVHVDSGQAVKSGQPLFDVEHSKATMEICASVDGFVLHDLTEGATVTFGARIARVVDAIDAEGSLPLLSTGVMERANASSSAVAEATSATKAPPASARPSSGDNFSVGLADATTSLAVEGSRNSPGPRRNLPTSLA